MFTDPIAMSLPKAKRVRHYDAAGVETAVPDDQWMLDFVRFTDPNLKVRNSAVMLRTLRRVKRRPASDVPCSGAHITRWPARSGRQSQAQQVA